MKRTTLAASAVLLATAIVSCTARTPEPAVGAPQPAPPQARMMDAAPADAPEIWVIAQEADVQPAMETMTVRGSYIRRRNFDLPTPLDSIQTEPIETAAPRARRAPAAPPRPDPYWHGEPPGAGVLLGFPVAPPWPDQHVPLPLEHTAVDAAIHGYIGTVAVKQRFANPFDTKIEAVYVFPLPEKAAVSEFLMTIGERTIRGILREREEAEAIYREARRQGYRASLLMQRRPNVFEQKVANIEPGNAIDIDIKYFHTLAYNDGWYSFVFPTVVGPRFNPPGTADPLPSTPRMAAQADAGAGAGVPYLAPGEHSEHDLSIRVAVNAGVAIEELKSTHAVDVDRDGSDSAVVELAAGTTVPDRDFVLDFRVAGEAIASNLLTYRDPDTGEGYFTLMAIPPRSSDALARQPLELLFVLDCSGSMDGHPLQQAKSAVRAALDRLQPNDTFQIIRFSDAASQFGPAPVLASADNIASAHRYLDALRTGGGTMMLRGVAAALDFPHSPSRLRFVSFLTDGYIGNEAEVLAAVGQRIGAARIFSFGVGDSVNRYLMERMARLGRGAAAYLGLGDSGRDVMNAFFDRISHPALTDVTIDWGAMQVHDTYPAAEALPDLFVGRPLLVAGRFTGSPDAVRIVGRAAGEERAIALGEAAPAEQALAKVWARLRIADLADRQSVAGDPVGALGQAILDTALKHQLASAYTSFVAVDSSLATAGDFGVTVRQAVPVPRGVRYETSVER